MANIEVNQITKEYKKVRALNDVSFSLQSGELFGLLGPNGAGKTTLVSIISTLLDASSGSISINGMNTKKNSKEIRNILGVIPQEIALYETLSIIDNLSFFGKLYGLKGKSLKKRIDEILEIIGLENRANDAVKTFSGGMKRRVNIGVGLIHKPEVAIFDEPTVGIDPQSRRYILDTIKRLNEDGMTVIYTSHYMEEIEFLCRNIGIIDEGVLKYFGDKEYIKKQSGINNIRIYTQDVNPELVDSIKDNHGIKDVRREDDGLSIDVDNISERALEILSHFKRIDVKTDNIVFNPANLESVFLNLTGKELRDNKGQIV